MVKIIQNLLISKNGVLLFSQNYGECHSFGPNPDLISSFLSAIQIFAKETTGDYIETIKFDKINIYFHKDLRDPTILYLIAVDLNEDSDEIRRKILKISNLFYSLYSDNLNKFKGIITPFLVFGDLIEKMKLIEKNCGNYLKCTNCPENKKYSKLIEYINKQKNKRDTKIRVFPKKLKKSLAIKVGS